LPLELAYSYEALRLKVQTLDEGGATPEDAIKFVEPVKRRAIVPDMTSDATRDSVLV
jgi:hypothetical protein